VTEKHSSLTDKCFPSGSADSYAALAGQYKEPHHTGDIRIKRLSGSTTAKAALLSGHEVLDGNRVSVSLRLLKHWLIVETTIKLLNNTIINTLDYFLMILIKLKLIIDFVKHSSFPLI